VLQHLAGKGHELHFLGFRRADDTSESIGQLGSLCASVTTVEMRRTASAAIAGAARSLLQRMPLLVTRDASAEMRRAVRAVVSRHELDAIHADQLWMAQYALQARELMIARGSNPRMILDQHNAVHRIPGQLARYERRAVARTMLRREGRLLKEYEAKVVAAFDATVWVSEMDRRAVLGPLRESDPDTMSRNPIIPIAVDPSALQPAAMSPARKRVTFVGGLHWPPNAQGVIWFLKKVWPMIRATSSDAQLTIVGARAPAELIDLAADLGQVELAGFVADLATIYSETAAFIVPLHAGGGMRVKIVDGWAHALPIVSTSLGAEGIDARPGENILIADSAEEFAGRVLNLLSEPDLAEAIGMAGRKTVETQYDWRTRYAAWDIIYR